MNDLRDFAKDAEEDDDNPVNPTYKEAQAFLGDKGRSQVFKEVVQEWPSQIRKPLKLGVHFAIDGLDWKPRRRSGSSRAPWSSRALNSSSA